MFEKYKESFEKPQNLQNSLRRTQRIRNSLGHSTQEKLKSLKERHEIESYSKSSKEYGPILVRYGVGIVFLLLGYDQVFNTENWLGWTPNFVGQSGLLSPEGFFVSVGVFNLVVGVLLLLGLFTKLAAALAVLHLIGVIFSIGYNDVAVRDVGLLLAALAVFLNGTDRLCLGRKLWKS